MLAHVAHVSWGLKHRIAHGVHGHEFMTSHHVHMTRHELMSNTPLNFSFMKPKIKEFLLSSDKNNGFPEGILTMKNVSISSREIMDFPGGAWL